MWGLLALKFSSILIQRPLFICLSLGLFKDDMTHRYVYSVLTGLCAIFSTLIVYGFVQYEQELTVTVHVDTEYEFVEVPGPIQPIPYIKQIDSGWQKLGKALFHSTLLSKDNTISCASCHNVHQGGEDGFPISIGINGSLGDRNAPTVLNSVFSFRQFWDGRSATLAEQAVGPIHNPVEMGTDFQQVIQKLNRSQEFVDAFTQLGVNEITPDSVVRAIVTYEESLITPDAPIDLYVLGNQSALTEQQKSGYEKFIGFGCVSCHQGVNIGGNLYQKIGRINVVPEKLLADKGRFNVTKNENDEFVFKVPSLRNINQTAPYFHNGSVEKLEDAIRIMAIGQLGITLTDQDVADIMALFEAFSGQVAPEL